MNVVSGMRYSGVADAPTTLQLPVPVPVPGTSSLYGLQSCHNKKTRIVKPEQFVYVTFRALEGQYTGIK